MFPNQRFHILPAAGLFRFVQTLPCPANPGAPPQPRHIAAPGGQSRAW
ncbi:MAG: hypothetical protein MZV64_60435 [Ignavibacteriales bacterium]|nr:hypothetical protein [Ignavibacteriales bacterium]